MFAAGATFHSSDGISTIVPGSTQQECARQWMQALTAIPVDAPTGEYVRGPSSKCPLQHSDKTALPTYAKIQGNKATALVIRPTEHTAAARVPNPPWRVVGTVGDRHNIVYLER